MASNTTNTEKLKLYLLGDEVKKGFLLEEDNNGKTIMLSGDWGAGKTHFWKEEIEREQQEIELDGQKKNKYSNEEYQKGLHSKLKQKNKACVYVSLYGKTSIESIELDVYMKAYQNIVGDAGYASKTVSVFTNLGKNLGNIAHKGVGDGVSWIENLLDKKKFDKAGEYLTDGGVICFDDFERKSKDIDLNDLFGFISQLAIEYKSKIVIILNSDVFKGKEAEVFKQVKEKTVNKYFYFKPSIEELFNSIYSDEKYSQLDEYKDDILKSIEDTEELNARIYIQVLDNCLEWKDKRDLDKNVIRVLVLGTINFVLNHIVLSLPILSENHYFLYKKFTLPYQQLLSIFPFDYNNTGISKEGIKKSMNEDYYTQSSLSDKIKVKLSPKTGSEIFSDSQQAFILDWLNTNEHSLEELWKYGYKLCYVFDVEKEVYKEIAEFIESGILL